MQCRSCHANLDYEDNYCRKCGAAVEVLELEVVRPAPPGPVAALRAAALPAVTSGASLIVAGTLLRFALRQLLGRTAARGMPLFDRRPLEADEVEEIFYYRRRRLG